MKKITLLILTFCALQIGNAQTNLFFDDFESYTDFIITGIGSWDTLDLDGLGTYSGGGGTFDNQNAAMAYLIFNPSVAGVTNADTPGAELRDFDPFSGLKYAAAWAGAPMPPVTANDDWLISPSIDLAVSGNSVTFQVKAMSNSYGDESYEVGVFAGTGTPTDSSDFIILGGVRTATYPDWEEVTVDLSAYDDTEIRIGIHYISSDVYMLMVDDFSVDTTLNLSVDDLEAQSFTYNYNNSLQSLNLNSNLSPLSNVSVFDILGKRVFNTTLSGNQGSINLSSITEGVYIAKVTTEAGTRTFRFVKN